MLTRESLLSLETYAKVRKEFRAKVDFPTVEARNPFVARVWARRRVEALLGEVRLEGETPERRKEIVELAEGHFQKARAIMSQNPRRVVRAPRIMGEAYHVILEGLVARGFAPPRQRVRLPRAKLFFIVLRNLV